MDIKQFFNTLRAIMYQLYSRKLMYVVFNGDPNHRDEWLFSNVPQETMLVYDETAEYHFSKVTIKNNEFLDEFYKRFPLLLTNGAIIHVVDFCSPLSKAEQLSDCSLSLTADDKFVITYSQKSKLSEDLIVQETKQVGSHLPDIEVDMYYTVWKSGLIKSEDPYHEVMSVKDITNEDGSMIDSRVVVVKDIAHPTDKFKAQHAMVIIQPGFTVPTLPAFLKALKEESDTFELVAGYDLHSVIVNCIYDTALLTCLGTHPAQRWFVKDRR